jgi:hypothetical protein
VRRVWREFLSFEGSWGLDNGVEVLEVGVCLLIWHSSPFSEDLLRRMGCLFSFGPESDRAGNTPRLGCKEDQHVMGQSRLFG